MKNLFKHIKPIDREFDRVNAELRGLRKKALLSNISQQSTSSVSIAQPVQGYNIQNFADSHGNPVFNLTEFDYTNYTLSDVARLLLTYIKSKEVS